MIQGLPAPRASHISSFVDLPEPPSQIPGKTSAAGQVFPRNSSPNSLRLTVIGMPNEHVDRSGSCTGSERCRCATRYVGYFLTDGVWLGQQRQKVSAKSVWLPSLPEGILAWIRDRARR